MSYRARRSHPTTATAALWLWTLVVTVVATAVVVAGITLAATPWMAVFVALLIAAGMLAMRRQRMR